MLNTPLVRAASLFSKKVVWLWKLPPEERKALWSSVSAKKKLFYGVSVLLSLLMTAFYYDHIEETPITKRRRFNVLTREQVDTMVMAERDNILKMMAAKGNLLPESHETHHLVHSIVTQLLSSNQSPDLAGLNFKVHVFDNSNLISAFCLPTGDLIISTGLVTACRSTEELSFLLGHELAHCILGHKTEHLSWWAIVNFCTDFLKEFWEIAESRVSSFQPLRLFQHKVVEVLLTYPYSDEMEREADMVGLTMAARACFDPVKACGVWTTLRGEEAKGEKKMEYLVLHPCGEHRHGNIASLLPDACVVWKTSGCGSTVGGLKNMFGGGLRNMFGAAKK